ncbi:MAG: hypothetical protein JXQ66_02220 [Campylobacterales bacterium]|nr:hypothetical protein [Campylobacterales bacterium]
MEVLNSTFRSSVTKSNLSYEEKKLTAKAPEPSSLSVGEEVDEFDKLDPKLKSIVLALEALTGKKIDISGFTSSKLNTQPSNQSPDQLDKSKPYLLYESYQAESNNLDLKMEGSAKTSDNKKIDFSLSIHWNEEFVQTSRAMIQDGKVFQDPLIISFDGMPPVASEQFEFDLNKNADKLNFLNNGAYLVNDKNKNNIADDGSELFGTKSGDGFLVLKQHDDDKNGWIDSSDSIYKNLKLWRPELDGDNQLVSLEEMGIGAISLTSTQIDFISKSSIDTPIANYKDASVALGEDGKAYGVFSVDLAM